MNRLIQTLFILLVILFTTGCGGGSNKAKKAQVTITNYTTKTENSKSPTVADYKVAGFPDVSESNIHRVNSLLMEMPSDEVDTFEEIKVVIDELLENNIAPKVMIIGANPVTQNDGSVYEDLGATASDDRDGNLTSYIHIVSDVNSSKDGNYTVTYSVEDSAGNKVIVIREVNIVLDTSTSIVTPDNNDTKEPSISPIVTPDNNDTKEPIISPEHNVTKLIIEDAEDGKIERWRIDYDHSNKAKIINIYDEEKGSNIIFLDGDERETGFIFKQSWEDTESKVVQWSMKTDEVFLVRIIVDTKNGERLLEYYPKDTGKGYKLHMFNEKPVHITIHGIGSISTNNKWHTYTRDLNNDLKRYEKDNELKAIKGIFFRGKLKIDDILFYASAKNLKINKPVIVNDPGVVLTFDDSWIDNWSTVMDIFKENHVHATFFCNRWGLEGKDITETEVAQLKEFEADGHEIGYHTKDHTSTTDEIYNQYSTIEEKARAYFNEQIDPGVIIMKERGFDPTSFSYPYISGQPEHNKLIRDTLPHIREFFAHVVLTDENVEGEKTIDEIKSYLDKIKKDKEIGVLLGHWIEKKLEPTNHSHKTSLERLKTIIKYAKSIGLTFYTLEEAHNIYLNQ